MLLGGDLGNKGKAFMDGISVSVEEAGGISLAPSTTCGYNEKLVACNLKKALTSP